MVVLCIILILLVVLFAILSLMQYCRGKRERAEFAEKEAWYQKQMHLQNLSLRDLLFARLIGGKYYRELPELLADGETVDVTFPHAVFCLLVARLETWGALFEDNRQDRREINFILRNVLENGFSGVTHAADVNGETVAVINVPALPGDSTKPLAEAARQVLEVLESEFGLTVTIAFSRVYHSPLELHQAYKDACRVLEFHQLLEDDAPVTVYEELTAPNVSIEDTAYLNLEQQLLQYAKQNSFPQMRKCLHEMIDLGFGASGASVETVRFRIYGAVNLLLYLAEDFAKVVGREVMEEIDPGPRLTEAESLGNIVAVIDDIFDALEQHTAHGQRTAFTDWVERIPQYIEENYWDPNLNVAAIADHFQMSTTYCSRLYKERYGALLRDAIQLRRLTAAKELFPSELNLNQIAEKSGFYTSLNMFRAFKKYEGISPGQYRAAHV